MNHVTSDFVADLLLYRLGVGLVTDLDNDLFAYTTHLYKQELKQVIEKTVQSEGLWQIMKSCRDKYLELEESEKTEATLKNAEAILKTFSEAYQEYKVLNG